MEHIDKILIVPDIHNKIFEADQIIDKEKPDKIVFLGDYFDDFNDTLEETHQTAEWLKKSMTDPNRIHLMGNHDLSYLSELDRCSGFSEGKLWAIKNTDVDLSKLKNYCWVGDWLCTHAGLSNNLYKQYNWETVGVTEFLEWVDKKILRKCSYARGGSDDHSGIFWCDYGEFEDIPDVKQIFGHTHGELRQTENHICIDTWLKWYALYYPDSNKMITKKNEAEFN